MLLPYMRRLSAGVLLSKKSIVKAVRYTKSSSHGETKHRGAETRLRQMKTKREKTSTGRRNQDTAVWSEQPDWIGSTNETGQQNIQSQWCDDFICRPGDHVGSERKLSKGFEISSEVVVTGDRKAGYRSVPIPLQASGVVARCILCSNYQPDRWKQQKRKKANHWQEKNKEKPPGKITHRRRARNTRNEKTRNKSKYQ